MCKQIIKRWDWWIVWKMKQWPIKKEPYNAIRVPNRDVIYHVIPSRRDGGETAIASVTNSQDWFNIIGQNVWNDKLQ